MYAMRPHHHPLVLGIFALAWIVFPSCDRKETPPPSNAKADSTAGDDDYVVVEPVPMNLLNPDDWKRVKDTIALSLAGTQTVSKCDSSKADYARSGADLWTDAHLRAVADNILAAPCYAGANLATILSQMEFFHRQLFLPSGLLGKDVFKVGLKKGETSHTNFYKFETAQGRFQFAGLGFASSGKYPYQVSLYGAPVNDAIPLLAQVSFKLDDAKSALAETNIIYLSEGANPMWLDTTLQPQQKKMSVVFGPVTVTDQVPARNWVDMSPGNDDETFLYGGYIWKINLPVVPANALSPSRFEWLQAGDIELFRTQSRSKDNKEMVQGQAFLPVADRIQLGDSVYDQTLTLFDDRSYENLMDQHVEEIVRRADVNAGCATYGNSLRAMFTSGAPASVTAAPADFCDTNSAFDLAGAITVLRDTCNAGKAVVITASATVGSVNLNVCSRLSMGKELSDPVYTHFPDGSAARAKVDPNAQHSRIQDELKAHAFPNYKDLLKTATPDFTSKKTSDFVDVQVLK